MRRLGAGARRRTDDYKSGARVARGAQSVLRRGAERKQQSQQPTSTWPREIDSKEGETQERRPTQSQERDTQTDSIAKDSERHGRLEAAQPRAALHDHQQRLQDALFGCYPGKRLTKENEAVDSLYYINVSGSDIPNNITL